ncbi:MSCRAMM family protein [Gemmiger formicilis]
MQKGLALVGCLLLCALFALPAHAAAPQNSYHYPGYNAAAEGEIDLMRYVKSVTLTVNGQEYTPQQLQDMKNSGNPLEMRVGDAASINFRFALCGRAYAADDPTRLDEAASTQTVYTNGTTYLNGETVAAGATGILDDSSLMVENTTAGNSFLRLGIGWLLEFCPDDVSINYSEGGVSFAQKGDALYLYFPNGIGSDTYADPGYFSLGVTLGEVIDEIRVPGTPGYYVPGGGDWVFPIRMVESVADMNGAISTYGDILVKKVWQTGGQEHPDATVILHYTENGEQKTARRTLSGDNATAKFTIRSGMTDCWLEEDMTGLEDYTSTLTTSEDGKTFTFTNTSSRTVAVSKRSLTGTDELPGAKLELYVLSSDGGQTLIDQWTSGETPHEVELNPGRFLLHETLAPAGYAMSLDIPFTLREDLTVQLDGDTGALEGDTLVVTDAPLEVKFAKVDEHGDPLPGAVLTLTDQTTGEEIDRWTTTTEPHVITGWTEDGTALVAGHTYVLHEESAPNGYQTAADITFVFNGDGTIPDHGYHTIQMEDKPETPPPSPTPSAPPPGNTPPGDTPPGDTPPERVQTGDSPWMWVWLGLGVLCLFGAGCTALYYHRRANIPAYLRLGMRDR